MWAINEKNLPYLAWKLYVGVYSSSIPAYTVGTNDDAVAAYIDSNITFERMASVRWLQIARAFADNQVDINADECDTGNLMSFTTPTATVSCDWLENLNLEAYEILTGNAILNVAGTPVTGATQTILSGTKAYNEFTALEHQNGNGAAVSVTSVTGGTDGLLVADTDYVVTEDANGIYGITIIDSTTVTTMAQDFAIVYDYTPSAAKYTGMKQVQTTLPKVVVKIVWCPDGDSENNTHYVVDAKFTGEFLTSFVDVVENGDVNPTSVEITTNKGWYVIDKMERL